MEVKEEFMIKELSARLCRDFPQTSAKLKEMDAKNLIFLFERFNLGEPLVLSSDGFSIIFEDRVLFLLDRPSSVEHNAYSVIRDVFNVLYDGEKILHRRDIEEKFIFQ